MLKPEATVSGFFPFRAPGDPKAHIPCILERKRMFARKLQIDYEVDGQRQPCPIKWLDNFSMRSFTNASVFDDTLPVADGRLEVGTTVPLDQLRDAIDDWFRRKGYLPKDAKLQITETSGS